MQFFARLVTFVCALALTAHASVPCTGWKTEQQSRLDCCVNHCPMDEVEAEHDGSHHPVPQQTDADACCAISERGDATPVAATVAPVLVALTSPLPLPGHAASPDVWRTAAPVPIRTVSTHLLLSVLLV
ncbi:MAG TPA: hypothetical protein VNK41_00845 [Vicinamibacterales bacterium]|nr:hypothetical protein [Vicinamibacterales bacterium]